MANAEETRLSVIEETIGVTHANQKTSLNSDVNLRSKKFAKCKTYDLGSIRGQ